MYQGSVKALPSWVADWTSTGKERQMPAERRECFMRVQPKTGGMLVETPKPQQVSDFHGHRIRQLQVRGVHIGSLVQIAEECNVGNKVFPFS
jgi:hypothetical protein